MLEKELAEEIIEEVKDQLRCRADAFDLKSSHRAIEKILRERVAAYKRKRKRKYKVIWEEQRYAVVEAGSPEEAEEIVKNGDYDRDYSKKITMQPKAVNIIS